MVANEKNRTINLTNDTRCPVARLLELMVDTFTSAKSDVNHSCSTRLLWKQEA